MQKKSISKGRFILLLLILLNLFSFSGSAYSQTKRISIKESSITIKDVIKKIEKLSRYNFLYNSKLIDVSQVISINKENSEINDILTDIFKNAAIDFKIIDRQIILTQKRSEINKSDNTSSSQNSNRLSIDEKRVISGVITDDNNEPLAGCVVLIPSQKTQVISDNDGKYKVTVNEKSPILIFSYIGMKTVTTTATDNTININMVPDFLQIEQVVVTGYQTLKKFNTTGAINSLDSKAIDIKSSYSLNKILEGAVAGLTVYKGDYRIRGGSSLSAGTKPMFIVDEFEVEKLPENMDIVENITVLKDAAASAIWGSRAANGVIVITTKQGKTDEFKVSYSNNFTITAKADFSDLNRANSEQMLNYQKEIYVKNFMNPTSYPGKKTGYPDSYQIFFDHYNGLIDNSEMDNRLAQLAKSSNKEQISEYLLQNKFSQNHLLSISGGTDKANYFLSTSYNDGKSTYVGTSNNSMNINLRSSYKLYSFLKVRADLNANFSKSDNGYSSLGSDIYSLYPFQLLKNENGYVYDYSAFNKVEALRLKGLGYLESGKNILEEVNLSDNKTEATSYKVRFGTDINIIKGVTANIDYQYEKNSSTNKNINSSKGYLARTLINSMTTSTSGVLKYNVPNADILDKSISNINSWAAKAGLNLNRSFGASQKHYVNAVLGFEIRKKVYDADVFRKLGYNDQLLSWQPIDQIALSQTGIKWWDGSTQYYRSEYFDMFAYTDNRETSSYGSVVYTYDNRYTASGSFRFDESNLFGADKMYRRNPIWSLGASWNISQEKFFKSDVVTDLIIRATTGLTGNFDRSGSTSPLMVATRMYLSSVGDYITRISSPPNPTLRWEKTRSSNISASVSLWNRLSISADFYKIISYDLLGTTILDPTTGFASARINAANMENKGVELIINGDIIKNRKFNWSTGLVFAFNHNTITKNNVSDAQPHLNRPSGVSRFVEGYARETIWSYRWAGLDNAGNPQTFDKDGNKTFTLSLEALEANGTYQPKYNGSLNSAITYQGLTLNVMFVYNFGHITRVEYPSMNPYEATPTVSALISERWRNPGDENNPNILPSISNAFNYRDLLTRYSSNSIRNAGFVRFRDILLNYQLPTKWLKETPFKKISITANATNLALWTVNKDGYDPEAIEPVKGAFSLKEPVSFTFGVKLDF